MALSDNLKGFITNCEFRNNEANKGGILKFSQS
jgi:hypothetical protein